MHFDRIPDLNTSQWQLALANHDLVPKIAGRLVRNSPLVPADVHTAVENGLFRGASKCNPQNPGVRSFLGTCCFHSGLDYLRARRRESPKEDTDLARSAELDPLRTTSVALWDGPKSTNPEVNASFFELGELMRNRLTPRQLLAVTLRAQGYNYEEIGEKLGLAASNAYREVKSAQAILASLDLR